MPAGGALSPPAFCGQGRVTSMERRDFFQKALAVLLALPFVGWLRRGKSAGGPLLWQIDPKKCIQCGRCATECVLKPSAVKCVHQYASCGYCEFCSGFFHNQYRQLNTGAENQRCPTGALQRRYVEGPYFEYTIDEQLCNGCGRCVKGCADFGNGSLFLQVRRDLCVNCNQCGIAMACPSQAFVRVAHDQPYLYKHAPKEPAT